MPLRQRETLVDLESGARERDDDNQFGEMHGIGFLPYRIEPGQCIKQAVEQHPDIRTYNIAYEMRGRWVIAGIQAMPKEAIPMRVRLMI